MRQSRQGRNEDVKLSLASSRSRGGTETQNSGGKSSARPRFRSEAGVGIADSPKCPNSGSRHEAECSIHRMCSFHANNAPLPSGHQGQDRGDLQPSAPAASSSAGHWKCCCSPVPHHSPHPRG